MVAVQDLLRKRIIDGGWLPREFGHVIHDIDQHSKRTCLLGFKKFLEKAKEVDDDDRVPDVSSWNSMTVPAIFPTLGCGVVTGLVGEEQHAVVYLFDRHGMPFNSSVIRSWSIEKNRRVKFLDYLDTETSLIVVPTYQENKILADLCMTLSSLDLIVNTNFARFERRVTNLQRACGNWLFKPRCADGTIGIVPRLSLETLFKSATFLVSNSGS